MNPSYLSAKEFANLCNTTKDTLRHYNEIGLLSPAYVSPGNYHYYTMSQLYTFELIELLQELGCTLAEIKQKLDKEGDSKLLDYLNREERLLIARRHRLQMSQFKLESTQRLIFRMRNQDWSAPKIITQNLDEYLLITPFSTSCEYVANSTTIRAHYSNCKQQDNCDNALIPFPMGHLLTLESLQSGVLLRTHLFSYAPKPPILTDCYYKRVSGQYLTMLHIGSIDTIGDSYQQLHSYIKTHQLEITGSICELNISDYQTSLAKGQEMYYISVLIS